MDKYTINEVESGYTLIETDFSNIILGKYDTKTEAIASMFEWIARDELEEAIDVFVAAMLLKFSHILSTTEIA